MNYAEELRKREKAVMEFHRRVDIGKFRGWGCSCDYEFDRMIAFKEIYDRWLS